MPVITIVPGQGLTDPVLSQVLTPAQYQAIVNAQRQGRDTACCYACAIEWVVCLFTPLWCVFCCHTCIEDSLAQSQVGDQARRLNQTLFHGQYVLSTINGRMSVNTDLIRPETVVVMQPGQTIMMPAGSQAMYVQPGQPVYSAQPGAPVYAGQPGAPVYAVAPGSPGQPLYSQPGSPGQPGAVYGSSPGQVYAGSPGQPVYTAQPALSSPVQPVAPVYYSANPSAPVYHAQVADNEPVTTAQGYAVVQQVEPEYAPMNIEKK